MEKLRVLHVTNKKLPGTDYRIRYSEESTVCEASFAMPGISDGLTPQQVIRVNFREGLVASFPIDLFRLCVYLRKNRDFIDWVHFYSTNLILFGPIIAWLAGVKSLFTLTGFGRLFSSESCLYRSLRPLYWQLFRCAASLSGAVLFQNMEDLKAIAQRFPKLADRFQYVGSAVSLPVVEKKSFDSPTLQVVLVARIMPDKGIEQFLEVAASLHKEDISFVLIGPASDGFADLHDKVKYAGESGVITFLGELDSNNVFQNLIDSHVLLFPSYGEGLSRVMIEAGYARTCPIAYDIPSNRDLVRNDCGFLLPVGETQRVVSIIRELAKKRSRLEMLATQYQKHIVRNYDLGVFVKRLDRIMENLDDGLTAE